MEILTVAYRVSKAQFGQLVEAAIEELPDEFAQFLEEVPIEVRDHPSESELRRAGVREGGLLLGLYVGRPRTHRNVEDSGALPDVIYIFQEPIQAVCDTELQLIRQVRVTVLHEIGHHFGLSEEDLERLGYR
jgi:predicted Zn-dependent protease with MMP-like domain